MILGRREASQRPFFACILLCVVVFEIFTLECCYRELKYVHAQWRLSIYGRRLCEWDKLSRWFFVHKLAHPNVRERGGCK